MDFPVTNIPILIQAITAHQKSEDKVVQFSVAVLNICFPITSKKEVNKIVEDNFRGEKDQIEKKMANITY